MAKLFPRRKDITSADRQTSFFHHLQSEFVTVNKEGMLLIILNSQLAKYT